MTFKGNNLIANLLPKQIFESIVNLPCVRKDGRNELKSILLSDVAIFSHFLVIADLQMTIRKIFSWSGLTIDSCHRYIQNNLSTKSPWIPKQNVWSLIIAIS